MRVEVTRGRAVALATVVFVLATLSAGWWLVTSQQEVVLSDWNDRRAQVSADGLEVTLHYEVGVCGEVSSVVRVIEGDKQVELTVVTTTDLPLSGDCPDIAEDRTLVARLDAPLGERELVDGHCNHPEWGITYACPVHA